ncbi:MAG: PorV/PorQ family protein [Elusimicrobia bacterium]|nr:PorV/PorQ family protein [Elusimicrobiota bacterium]
MGIFVLLFFAGNFLNAAPGTTAADFLKIGLGPRPAALGDAYTGLADDVNAIAHNPAGLMSLRRQEATFMHHEYAEGIEQDYLAYAYPVSRSGALGFAVNALRTQAIASYDANDQPLDSVSARDLSANAAVAFKIKRLALGLSAKRLSSRLADVKASGLATDAGLLVNINNNLRFGAAAQNLGSDIKFIKESFPLPSIFKTGVALRTLLPFTAGHYGTLAVDRHFPRGESAYSSAGLEIISLKLLALRIGYNEDRSLGHGLSLGAGIKLTNREFFKYSAYQGSPTFPDIEIDYAFADFGDFGQTHRMAMSVRFGPDKHAQKTIKDLGPREIPPDPKKTNKKYYGIQ